MTEFVDWREVKAKAREIDPAWDNEERVERRRQARQRTLASINGAKLADIRRDLGMTQAELGRETGLSQARISQIEKGEVVSLDILTTYITGLGGQVEIVARIGNLRLDVA